MAIRWTMSKSIAELLGFLPSGLFGYTLRYHPKIEGWEALDNMCHIVAHGTLCDCLEACETDAKTRKTNQAARPD